VDERFLRVLEAGGQGIDQRGIPVDGDFVGPVVRLFIMPITCPQMRSADEITGPRVRHVVAAGAVVVRMQRRTETDAGDERPAVAVAAKQMIQGVEAGFAIGPRGRRPASVLHQKLRAVLAGVGVVGGRRVTSPAAGGTKKWNVWNGNASWKMNGRASPRTFTTISAPTWRGL